MTFSIAKGRSRHPPWNESDKSFSNSYMLAERLNLREQ
jgi:hypothetical protein